MNKIVNLFKQYSNTDDVLKLVYGVPSSEHFDCVFVAPVWSVEDIFDLSKINSEFLFKGGLESIAHKIEANGKKYLHIKLNIGAPNIIDFCLACNDLNCDKFVFIGSAGSLVPEIKIGDVIIPEYSISGEGASLYLYEKLNPSNMYKKAYASSELNQEIRKICDNQNIKTIDAVPISMDSIMCEYQHLSEFKEMGANVIEMETAAFFNAMNAIGKPASAILVISDNSSVGQHLIDSGEDTRKKYRAARTCVQDILLNI